MLSEMTGPEDPLFTRINVGRGEEAIFVNPSKWKDEMGPEFLISEPIIVSDDQGKRKQIIHVRFDKESGIPMIFKSPKMQGLKLKLIQTQIDDPKAKDTSPRTGRFPNDTKKEKHLPDDLIVFGTTEQRTQTHAFQVPLQNISREIEELIQDPGSYKDKVKNARMVGDEILSVIPGVVSDLFKYDIDQKRDSDPRVSKFQIYMQLLRADMFSPGEPILSNISNATLMRFPPKKEIVSEVIERSGEDKVITFDQIRDAVAEEFSKRAGQMDIKLVNTLLDHTGDSHAYFIILRSPDGRIKPANLNKFLSKYDKIFSTLWPTIEQTIGSGIPDQEKVQTVADLGVPRITV